MCVNSPDYTLRLVALGPVRAIRRAQWEKQNESVTPRLGGVTPGEPSPPPWIEVLPSGLLGYSLLLWLVFPGRFQKALSWCGCQLGLNPT